MSDRDSFCALCGDAGIILYEHQPDRVHGHPGDWDILCCGTCSLYWLWPMPTGEELASYYSSYHTHGKSSTAKPSLFQHLMTSLVVQRRMFHWRPIRWLFFPKKQSLRPRLIRHVGQYLSAYLLRPPSETLAKLLDVGAGNGWFVRLMLDIGWNAVGIEPDPEAAAYARDIAHVPVLTSDLQMSLFEPQSFDVITLRHVVEHLTSPDDVLRASFTLLKPGGRLIIICPNSTSLGSRHFKECWRGLEVPRHVFLYNPSNLSRLVTTAVDCEIEGVQTESFNAWWFYLSSVTKKTSFWARIGDLFAAVRFAAQEGHLHRTDTMAGEEVVLIARKK